MLTVPGLCWLCQMPLALSHWGICSVCAHAVRQSISLCPQCGLPAAHPSLPCGRCLQKPPPWQRLVSVSDYKPPLSLLVHQLKFTAAAKLPPPWRVCCYKRYSWRAAAPACSFLTESSAFRSGRADTGGGDLTKAICYADR